MNYFDASEDFIGQGEELVCNEPLVDQVLAADDANKVVGILRYIDSDIKSMTSQYEAEVQRLKELFERQIAPLKSRKNFLELHYSVLFENMVKANKGFPVKLMFGNLTVSKGSWAGSIVDEAALMPITKELFPDVIAPEKTVITPESIKWGELKKKLSLVDGKVIVVKVDKTTGEAENIDITDKLEVKITPPTLKISLA